MLVLTVACTVASAGSVQAEDAFKIG